ncbi:MAG: hypothetical protein O2887_11045 [Bacteroidetes bacterium]|nr:hypothetical protein [Bacteroidota bacterium]
MKIKIDKFFLLIAIYMMISYSEETIMPPESLPGSDYFRLEKGFYKTYDVELITFTLVESDTTKFQLHEIVVDSFINGENEITHILHRFIRPDDLSQWKLDSVWTARKTRTTALVVENNVPIVKMAFPVSVDIEWDGNAFSSLDEQLFHYINISAPLSQSGLEFDNTVTVVQSDFANNLIFRDERSEIYAAGVGMVTKDFTVLNFCARPDCLGQDIIESGRIEKMKLIAYGKE